MGRAKRKPVVAKGSIGYNSGGRGFDNDLSQSFIAGSGQSVKHAKQGQYSSTCLHRNDMALTIF